MANAKKTKLYFTEKKYVGMSINLSTYGIYKVDEENSISVPENIEREIREKFKGSQLNLEIPLTGKAKANHTFEKEKHSKDIMKLSDEHLYQFSENIWKELGYKSVKAVRKTLPMYLRSKVDAFLNGSD